MKEKILVVFPNWIGDVIFTTPALHVLRLNFPDAHFIGMVWPECADVLRGVSDVDEIMVYHERGRHRGLWGKIQFIMELRRRKIHQAYLFSRSKTKALLCILAGIRRRSGYATNGRALFLTTPVAPVDYDSMHRVDYYLKMLDGAGFKISGKHEYIFKEMEEDVLWAKDFLKRNGVDPKDLKIILNPGGNWRPKRWSPSLFGRLSRKTIETLGARIIVTGVSKDSPLLDEICREADRPILSALGKTSLGQLAALIKLCDLYIGNDSGPTHLAHALKKPLIALFGPQDPEISRPYGKGCAEIIFKNKGCKVPCFLPECEVNRCIDEISVEEVFEKAVDLLKRFSLSPGLFNETHRSIKN